MRFTARQLQKGMKWWPPFLGAGIRVRSMSDDFREAVVELRLGRFNRNAVGTHFGGSLYAMTDPFFMIMLLRNLGGDYLVWDKSGSIEYVAPGRGIVSARFALDEARIADIRAQAAGGEKVLPQFSVDVKDEAGAMVARVYKTLYVRLKPRHRPGGGPGGEQP
jgi:acyl-coenzyme A thioesterase PaaI-like protein